jgi:chloramphenicol O-acetyltransferase
MLKKLSYEKRRLSKKKKYSSDLLLIWKSMKTAQEHQDFIDTLRKEQKVQLRNLQKEIRKAEADGYKRGIDEMLYRMNKSKGL